LLTPPDSLCGSIHPADGRFQPAEPAIAPPTKLDQYTEPVWSVDGKFIYYVHVNFGQLRNAD